LDSAGFGYGPVVSLYERGNEPSGSTKSVNLSSISVTMNYKIFKEHPLSWSLLLHGQVEAAYFLLVDNCLSNLSSGTVILLSFYPLTFE
jgi:hypothetical protein